MTAVLIAGQRQPEISYHPDLANFHSRSERLKQQRSPNQTLPDGFPQELTSPLVWEGKDFTNEKEWTFSLTETQLQEINNALIHFKCE